MEWLERYWGKRGWFYEVAGYKASSHRWTMPLHPSTLQQIRGFWGPENPEKVASELSEMLEGTPVLIVDINDLGGTILGSSLGEETEAYYLQFLKDNPLGQSKEQTPMGIIRELE